jgi:hypothetical protein
VRENRKSATAIAHRPQLSKSSRWHNCFALRQAKVLEAGDRHADLKMRIRQIYERHKGRYGYWRITAA